MTDLDQMVTMLDEACVLEGEPRPMLEMHVRRLQSIGLKSSQDLSDLIEWVQRRDGIENLKGFWLWLTKDKQRFLSKLREARDLIARMRHNSRPGDQSFTGPLCIEDGDREFTPGVSETRPGCWSPSRQSFNPGEPEDRDAPLAPDALQRFNRHRPSPESGEIPLVRSGLAKVFERADVRREQADGGLSEERITELQRNDPYLENAYIPGLDEDEESSDLS